MAPDASFLLAALPPPELAERVRTFQRSQGIQDAAAEPHITLRSRAGLSSDTDWAEAQAVAAGTPPFAVEVGAPQVFPGRAALYLEVQGTGLDELHLALLAALPGEVHRTFKPHLTLALGRRGVDLTALEPLARAEFGGLAQHPLTFTATALTLLRKPGPGDFYRPVESWPLGS